HNIDATIIAEAPKMAPHIPQMRANIASALGINSAAVSIKATTTEKLGFCGRGEGMAAEAIATIIPL
ncbi:MAG: 2-C-methyl-D-erythritol 2,4-cyclodiphosphate synthase, partial [Firmicutes bacterium]|nr:2-C-methyl-D-erythritol 2,4-cyclodiphosphate synthase [Bacillota bacterium]